MFAPGKVILLGEHAVVYGHPALAGALGVGVRVTVERTAGGARLRVPEWGAEVRPGERAGGRHGPLAQAYTALVETLSARPGVVLPPLDLEARFGLPAGAGLGSSAALSVAVARALAGAAGLAPDDELVSRAAAAAETVFHGRPSGIDQAVAARGGFGVYVRGQGFSPLEVARPVPLVIGHTGRARDTRGRVQRVAELVEERPAETRERFAAIEALVRRAARAVRTGDLPALGEAMNGNQAHLEALEVSCPEIGRLCELAREAGALGAKLTGGGGGGCVLALAPGGEEAVRAVWERAGFESFVTTVGGSPNAPDAPPRPGREARE